MTTALAIIVVLLIVANAMQYRRFWEEHRTKEYWRSESARLAGNLSIERYRIDERLGKADETLNLKRKDR